MTDWVRSLPVSRPRVQLDQSWPVLAAVLLALAMGWQLGHGQLTLGIVVLAALVIVGMSAVAWLPLLIVVLVAGSFAELSAFPQLPLPGPDPYLSEMVFAAAICAWAISPAARDAFAPTWRKAAVAIVVLVTAIVAGAFIGISNGAEASEAIGATRPMLFYALFFPAVAAFREPRLRRVTLMLLGLVTAVLVILQIVQGLIATDRILFYVNDPLAELLTCPETVCADPGAYGFPRVRPPGMPLVYAACAFAGAYVLWGPPRRRVLALGFFGLTFLGILISLNRNMIIGLVLGLAVATLLTPSRARTGVALIAVSLVAGGLLLFAQGNSEDVRNPAAKRVLSLADVGGLLESQSYRDRVRENDFALAAIESQPITGIGWGTPFGEKMTVSESGRRVVRDQDFVHQQYLGLWMRTGLTGLVAFLAAAGMAVFVAARSLRRGVDVWLAAGVVSALVAIAFSSTAMILLMDTAGIVVVSMLIALGMTLRRGAAEGAEASA